MSSAAPPTKVPTGTLKQLNPNSIKIGERFRKDFSGDITFQESVRDKGILQPITVGKDNLLLAGERRLKAALAVGLEKIPALVREVEGEIDMREIELVENTFRKDFTWQERANLVAEIDRLYKEKDYDWSGRKTAILLSQSAMNVSRNLELARAMTSIPELAQQETASDAFKLLKSLEERALIHELNRRQLEGVANEALGQPAGEVVTPSGDVFRTPGYSPDLAARIRIANANYRIGDVFEDLADMPTGGVIHLIECDPPYGIDLTKMKRSKDSVDSTVHGYEEVPAENYDAFLQKLCSELYRVASRDCWMFFWFGPTWFHEVKTAITAAGWQIDDIPAIWVKNQGQTLQPEIYLARMYEPFFIARKGKPFMNQRGRSNVFIYPGTPGQFKYHPTERPVNLIEEILSTFGVARQVVFSPFLGSGATLRACYRLGMLGYGNDLNDQYKASFMLAVEEDAKVILANNQPVEKE